LLVVYIDRATVPEDRRSGYFILPYGRVRRPPGQRPPVRRDARCPTLNRLVSVARGPAQSQRSALSGIGSPVGTGARRRLARKYSVVASTPKSRCSVATGTKRSPNGPSQQYVPCRRRIPVQGTATRCRSAGFSPTRRRARVTMPTPSCPGMNGTVGVPQAGGGGGGEGGGGEGWGGWGGGGGGTRGCLFGSSLGFRHPDDRPVPWSRLVPVRSSMTRGWPSRALLLLGMLKLLSSDPAPAGPPRCPPTGPAPVGRTVTAWRDLARSFPGG